MFRKADDHRTRAYSVRTLVAAALCAVCSRPGAAQVLAPPPLPGQDQLAERLAGSIETKDLAAYGALLSEKLLVFEDGARIAATKDEWLDKFGPKLIAKGVVFSVSPGFSSTGRLLFIEYFNSAASWGGDVPRHCCWSYDAVAYDVADGKVSVIRRLRGGDQKLPERER